MVSSTDPITFWLNNAGKRKILTKSETLELARKIQSGDPASEDYRKLINKLVEHNLKLVVNFVNKFMASKGAKKWGDIATLDYLQMGVLGLIRAAELFDPERGYSFTTYATFWMRSFIGRYNFTETASVYIPENACRETFKYIHSLKAKVPIEGLTNEHKAKAAHIFSIMRADSLDRELDNGCLLHEAIAVDFEIKDQAKDNMFTADVEDMLDKCGIKEESKDILRSYYVLGMSYKEIAQSRGLDVIKVSNIIAGAIRKIRSSNKAGKMLV